MSSFKKLERLSKEIREGKKTALVTLRLTTELETKLDELAGKLDRTRNWTLAALIETAHADMLKETQ